MTQTSETQTLPLDVYWQAAQSRVTDVVKRHNPTANEEELGRLSETANGALVNLATSDQLKFVLTTKEDGSQDRTVEPVWAETPGFGIAASEFAELLGLEDASEFDLLDPTSNWFLSTLADATRKPISALINGEYIAPVMPVQVDRQSTQS